MIAFGAPPRQPVRVALGRGVVVTLGPLDTFDHSKILQRARQEVEAITQGRATRHAWGLTEEEHARIVEDADTRAAVFSWMRAVLIATRAVLVVEGVADAPPLDEEAGRFDVFKWLLRDARFEAHFSRAAMEQEHYWSDEGNA